MSREGAASSLQLQAGRALGLLLFLSCCPVQLLTASGEGRPLTPGLPLASGWPLCFPVCFCSASLSQTSEPTPPLLPGPSSHPSPSLLSQLPAEGLVTLFQLWWHSRGSGSSNGDSVTWEGVAGGPAERGLLGRGSHCAVGPCGLPLDGSAGGLWWGHVAGQAGPGRPQTGLCFWVSVSLCLGNGRLVGMDIQWEVSPLPWQPRPAGSHRFHSAGGGTGSGRRTPVSRCLWFPPLCAKWERTCGTPQAHSPPDSPQGSLLSVRQLAGGPLGGRGGCIPGTITLSCCFGRR